MRSLTSRPEIWNMVPPEYRLKYWEMQDGGVKSGTSKTYTNNMLNYWGTMRKLNIPDSLSLALPIDSTLINIYLIHCINFRKKPNVWSTVRGKLRAIDYFAQIAGVRQCWWKDAALFAAKQYIKNKHPNEGSNTLPVTADIMKKVLIQTLEEKVYLKKDIKGLKAKKWAMTESTCNSRTRARWYIWVMGVLFMTILGLRQSECWRNHDQRYTGYGIWMSDITTYYINKKTKKIREGKSGMGDQWEIHHLRVRLRHTKNRKTGQHVFLRIGRTYRELDPAVLIHQLLVKQKSGWKRLRIPPKQDQDYLFGLTQEDDTLKLNKAKEKWKKRVAAAIDISPEQYRFHGTRKGFATQLLRSGLDLSYIAFAGRWTLSGAIYAYLKWSQSDLLPVVRIFLYGRLRNQNTCDMDKEQAKQVIAMRNGNMLLNAHALESSYELYSSNLRGNHRR